MEIDVVDGGCDKVLNIHFSFICRGPLDFANTYKGEDSSSNAQSLAGRNRQRGR